MRPYGVQVIESPDAHDIKIMGAKSSVGQLAGAAGLYRGYCSGPTKARTRRYWKRVARAEGKQLARAIDVE